MFFLKKVFKKIAKAFNALTEDEVPKISSLKRNLSRESLKRNCRVLFIDDQPIELVEDLRKEGFSIDQDFSGNDVHNIEKGYYDLIILDYHGVGKKYGKDDGLSLLKTIKRVNPAVYILAYTTRNLSPQQSAEFYTLTDGSLNKESGVGEAISRIEEALKEAAQPERVWAGILKCKSITQNSPEAKDLEKRVMRALINSKQEEVKILLGDTQMGEEGKELISHLIKKLIEIYATKGLSA